MTNNKQKINKKVFLKYFVLIAIPTLILLAWILNWFYRQDLRVEKEITESQTTYTVDIQKNTIAQDFTSIISDILNLSDWKLLNDVINGEDPDKYLAGEYLSYSARKRIYDQIRFLDKEGMEIVRVNYNNGEPYIVATDKLQQKKHRYYFKDAYDLNRGEVFVSPLDLNIENKQIERPLKPMIRFGTPVFDKQGNKQGIVLFNYFGKKLLDNFSSKSSIKNNQSMLLNTEGFWLKSADPGDEWGFMFEDGGNRTFGAKFPDAWERISKSEEGQFYTDKGLFTFCTIYPVQAALEQLNMGYLTSYRTRGYKWKIVSFIPERFLQASPAKVLRGFLVLFGYIGLLVFVTSGIAAFAIIKKQESQKEMQEAAEMKLHFVSMVTHELRSPLTAMKGSVDTIIDGLLGDINEKQKDMLLIMNRNIDRLSRLTTDVLNFHKGYKGKLQLNMEKCNIYDLINEIQEIVKNDIERKGLILYAELDKDLPEIYLDRDKIEQVLTNLINNAVKFTEEGYVKITASLADKNIKISVEDSGRGVPHTELEKLFEGFYQVSSKHKNITAGTGLGLAISKDIIKSYNGKIWAESEIDKGTTVSFILPIIEHHEG